MGLKTSHKCQKLPMLVFFAIFRPITTIKTFSVRFPCKISHKIFPQDFPELNPDWLAPHHPIPNAKFPPVTAFLKLAFSPPPCPARFSCKIFLQNFPARFSQKNFPQDFPELNPDWLAPHHPIPNAKFPPVTAFLKLAFSPPPCPARFSCKIFLQDFPTRFSHKIFPSWILIGWLPITLFQMLNFHQSLLC